MRDEPMTTQRARNVARTYKTAADAFQDLDVLDEAAHAERRGQWWMTYSRSLGAKPPELRENAAHAKTKSSLSPNNVCSSSRYTNDQPRT
jgi:hypothetical protein